MFKKIRTALRSDVSDVFQNNMAMAIPLGLMLLLWVTTRCFKSRPAK